MKLGLIYHTDFQGNEITHSKEALKDAAELYDEIIVLGVDTANLTTEQHIQRTDDILEDLPNDAKIFISTANLTKQSQRIPDMETEREIWEPSHEIKGTYFNQESVFHPRFLRILKAIKKLQGETIWIPYTGSYFKSMLTLPQIAILSRKFDRTYLQPNYLQKRYNKCRKCAENLARFCKVRKYGIEFEIDSWVAKKDSGEQKRALEYFEIYKDFEDRAFYTAGLSIPAIKEFMPEYYKEMKK